MPLPARAEGGTAVHGHLPAVQEHLGRIVAQPERTAVQPGQIGRLGRLPADRRHLRGQQGTEPRTVLGQPGEVRGLGEHDAARRHYAASLRAYRDYDDAWAMAYLLEDIGLLAALSAEPERAFELVGAADTLRQEIGAPRAPALEQLLDAQLALGAERLSAERCDELRRRGQALGLDRAVEAALAPLLLEPVTGTGPSWHLAEQGERWKLREYAAHRSVYHLKEADPQAFVVPRLQGQVKAAVVSVQLASRLVTTSQATRSS